METYGKTGWPLVGNEGINLYIGILGMKIPSFPTKGQLENGGKFLGKIFGEVFVEDPPEWVGPT